MMPSQKVYFSAKNLPLAREIIVPESVPGVNWKMGENGPETTHLVEIANFIAFLVFLGTTKTAAVIKF